MLKHPTILLSIALIVVVLALAACGGGAAKPAGSESQPAAAAGGNADAGKKLFNEPVIVSAGSPGCVTCHSLEKGKTLVGPSMAGIATVAAADIKSTDYKGTAKTVEEFLKESIGEPGCHGDPGLPARHHAEDLHQAERTRARRPGRVPPDSQVVQTQHVTPALGRPVRVSRSSLCRGVNGARPASVTTAGNPPFSIGQ